MKREKLQVERLLAPYEVAAMFGVGQQTVTRWSREGLLTTVRTLGNHRRFKASEVEALLKRGRS